ncbi:hypothetical protein [Salinicoccus albus]|uniref:hypothetical protein n=1 Tax=Salinicoccus albus TaxID=418756 RepID=UPI00036910C6|nr:hypothetical protein [Salinicoccus albus]
MSYRYKEDLEEAIRVYLSPERQFDNPIQQELDEAYKKAEAFNLADDLLMQLFDDYKWKGFKENDEASNQFADEIERVRTLSLKKVFDLEEGDRL